MFDAQFPFVTLRPALVVQFGQHQDGWIDRHMAADLLMLG